ncbi:MAG: ATP-binding cassette domain-containing protein, partial [Bacteroidota bacterium]
MIRLESVCKTYRGGIAGETVALDRISIDLAQGEYTILIGVNGCGKSSLLHAIAGSVIPDSGQVLLNNLDVTRMPEHHRSHSLARLFQNPLMGTAPSLSILENFRLAALRSKPKGLRIGIDKAFRERVAVQIGRLRMGLEDRLDLPMSALSGGQRQALTLLMGTMDECS